MSFFIDVLSEVRLRESKGFWVIDENRLVVVCVCFIMLFLINVLINVRFVIIRISSSVVLINVVLVMVLVCNDRCMM